MMDGLAFFCFNFLGCVLGPNPPAKQDGLRVVVLAPVLLANSSNRDEKRAAEVMIVVVVGGT
jgi:hypothetical protein